MVVSHVDRDRLARYFTGRLAGDASLEVADHLAACESCREQAIDAANLGRRLSPLRAPAAAEHLSYETLAEIAEGHAPADAQEHLAACAMCAHEAEELRGLVEDRQSCLSSTPVAWWKLTAAAAAAVLVPLVAVRLYEPRQTVTEAPPQAEQPAAVSTAPETPPAQTTLVLRDSSGDIEIDAAGELRGVPSAHARRVLALLRMARFESPAFLAPLVVEAQAVRGDERDARGAQVLAPVGVAVLDDRPELRWTCASDAKVRVEVYDEKYRLAARSGLRTGPGRWRPAEPLPRGRTYAWQIVIGTGEEARNVPAAPAAPARFHVVSASAAEEIAAAKATGSHLILAEALARHGLRAEAARELGALRNMNPDSDFVRRLQDSL